MGAVKFGVQDEAKELAYDNATTGLAATTIQQAIDLLHSTKEPANSNILKTSSIGVTVQGYNSNLTGIDQELSTTSNPTFNSLAASSVDTSTLLIDGLPSWTDILGDVTPKQFGTNAAEQKNYIGNITGWTHGADTAGELIYHIPHDYVPGTDVFIHVHWGHNGTNISGSFVVKFYATYANRTYPATTFSSEVIATLTVDSLNMTNSPRYCHRVDEIQLSTHNGSATQLNTDLIEVDGLVMIHYVVDTIPSITGSEVSNLPYIQTIDMHIQTNTVGTKNKDPNFRA